MLMSLLSADTLTQIRRQRAATMTHTYTWTQRVGTTVDSEGGTIPSWAPDIVGKSCHLLPMMLGRVDSSGAPLDLEAPKLIVAWDDPLNDGDAVKHVQDSSGTVVLTGPAIVQSATPQLAADISTHKVVVLSFEMPRPSVAAPQ